MPLPPPPPMLFEIAPIEDTAAPADQEEASEDDPEEILPAGQEGPGHAPAAFHPGTLEIKIRTAFNGAAYGPFSLVGAFLSWTEFQVAVDGGVFTAGDLSIGLGAEAFYGQPWFLQLLSRGVVGASTGASLRWRLIETGVAGRATFHYGRFETLDPYALVLAGPTLTRMRVRLRTDELSAEGRFATAGMRLGLGGGLAVAAPSGFVGGIELRYLAGFRFQRTAAVELRDDADDLVELFEWSSNQRPPSGASWVFWAGYRF